MTSRASDVTHFGFEDVALGAKQSRVDAVFDNVAARYDLMNDLMSVGLHRAWKDRLVAMVNVPKRAAFRHLDVAGGTGDIAFRILRAGNPRTAVTVLDINPSMLQVGRERALKRNLADRLTFVEGNAEALPLENSGFDAFTVSFGIRNVPRIELAIAEAYRVLKRGGQFLCLEFSHVDQPILKQIYESYSFNLIPRLGEAVTGDYDSYRYLVESIRRFPRPERFAAMIEEAGFRNVGYDLLTNGVVAIHRGWKL